MMPEQREFGTRVFAALGNAARLDILDRLAQGPASVNEIAEATGLKQSMTSQHLAVLLNAGVVVFASEGNHRIYSLRGPRIARILELLEEFYTVHLENLRDLVAQHYESGVVTAK